MCAWHPGTANPVAAHWSCAINCLYRKNKPAGSTLSTKCWCGQSKVRGICSESCLFIAYACKATCPTHALWKLLENVPYGQKPFSRISAAVALHTLRSILVILDVKDAAAYRCHDIRRGHALDLQVSGSGEFVVCIWIVVLVQPGCRCIAVRNSCCRGMAFCGFSELP